MDARLSTGQRPAIALIHKRKVAMWRLTERVDCEACRLGLGKIGALWTSFSLVPFLQTVAQMEI